MSWRAETTLLVLLTSCASEPTAAERYLEEPGYRRDVLVSSLGHQDNTYARLRLEHYASGDSQDWERLPEYNPLVEPLRAEGLGRELGGAPTVATALSLEVDANDEAGLVALGRDAFVRYPVQMAPYLESVIDSPEAARRYGFWLSPTGEVGGLVRVHQADGSQSLALTCSSCHAATRNGSIEPGLPNAELDLGRLLVAAHATPEQSAASDVMAWGSGRVDVTTAVGSMPQAIPDLRPLHWLTHLHHEANVAVLQPEAVAERIETLIIESNAQVLRPPRIVALALARYLDTLATALPDAETAAAAEPQGAAIFAHDCSGCHAGAGLTGPPVRVDDIGSDPALALSPARGTGAYRVPSLHGVSTRGPLLHDGTLPDVASLLDPARLRPDFAGRLHGAGAVPGHRFGLALAEADRRALSRYLEGL